MVLRLQRLLAGGSEFCERGQMRVHLHAVIDRHTDVAGLVRLDRHRLLDQREGLCDEVAFRRVVGQEFPLEEVLACFFARIPAWASQGTMRTGHAARRRTRSETDPSLNRRHPRRRLDPRTTRSTLLEFA